MTTVIRRHGTVVLCGLLGLAALAAVPALAEDPTTDDARATEARAATAEPAQAEPSLKSKAPPGTTNSLAAAAAKIRLNRPEGSSGLVISNDNLARVSSQGTVSVAGGVQAGSVPSPSTAGATAEGADNPANAMVQQYHQQKATVEGLEARLKHFDEQLAKPSTDPHYPNIQNSPHLRAGGVQDPAQAQRDNVAAQLAAERKKLDALRNQARRDGVPLE